MTNYTPSEADVLEAWVVHVSHDQPTALDLVNAYESFKRFIARVQAEAQVEALRDAAVQAEAREVKMHGSAHWDSDVLDSIREYADRIAREAGIEQENAS